MRAHLPIRAFRYFVAGAVAAAAVLAAPLVGSADDVSAVTPLFGGSVERTPPSLGDSVEPTAPLADKDNPFTISISDAKAKVGAAGAIKVTVKAADGFKCNDQYPNKIKKLKGDGVEFASKVVKGTIEGKTIVYSVAVTPTSAGKHAVTGQIRFSVCNDKACYIKKAPLKATVTGT